MALAEFCAGLLEMGCTILGGPVKGSTGISCSVSFRSCCRVSHVTFKQMVSNWVVTGDTFINRGHFVFCLASYDVSIFVCLSLPVFQLS